jgi:hypothetical protein
MGQKHMFRGGTDAIFANLRQKFRVPVSNDPNHPVESDPIGDINPPALDYLAQFDPPNGS